MTTQIGIFDVRYECSDSDGVQYAFSVKACDPRTAKRKVKQMLFRTGAQRIRILEVKRVK